MFTCTVFIDTILGLAGGSKQRGGSLLRRDLQIPSDRILVEQLISPRAASEAPVASTAMSFFLLKQHGR